MYRHTPASTIYSQALAGSLNPIIAFTLNTKDQFYNDRYNEHPDDKWRFIVCHRLKYLNRCCDSWALVPELSEVGRLHCHGFISISDKVKWKKSVLPMLMRCGKVKLKFNVNEKWHEYVLKNIGETAEIMRDFNVVTKDNVKPMMKRWFREILENQKKQRAKLTVDITHFLGEASSDEDSFTL